MILVDVGALDLAHVSEVVSDHLAVVIADASDLIPALIGVEAEFFSFHLHFLGLLGEHVLESFVFVLKEVVFQFQQFDVILEAAPFVNVFLLEQFIFLIDKGSLNLNISLFRRFSNGKQFSEGFMLIKMVLHVLPNVLFNELPLLCDEVTRPSDHLR